MNHTLIALIFLAGGFTQGVSGFGSGLLAMPLLLFFIDVKEAVPLAMLNGIVITSMLSIKLRHHVDRNKVMPIFFGSLPGIVVGALFLKGADSDLLKGLLGLLLVSYTLYSLLLKPHPRQVAGAWGYLAGFATGVIGAAFSAGGPPTIIYSTLRGWSKDEIKATLSAFFWANGVLVAVSHAVQGLTTSTVLSYFSASALPVMTGVWLGSRLYGVIPRRLYLTIILLLLLAMGLLMVATSL
ncbi:MAG: sulfite exporter TauE/SafE family protein [Thermodesulfobacteriota bacterium]